MPLTAKYRQVKRLSRSRRERKKSLYQAVFAPVPRTSGAETTYADCIKDVAFIDNTIMDVVLGRMAKNQEFCEKYLEDEEFRREVDRILLPLVHERLSKM
jgi:hypothetical protein